MAMGSIPADTIMVTLAASIQDRYQDDTCVQTGNGIVIIVSVSSSPQSRAGKLPRGLSLIDYNVETMGSLDTDQYPTSHIQELDLSDNLIMDWQHRNIMLSSLINGVFND